MSIRLMTKVWDLDLQDSEKIVLLALADNANDEGICWPSIATLMRKCSKSERTVQSVIKRLEMLGHISWKDNPGKGRLYTVHPRSDSTPAAVAPPQPLRVTPAAVAPKPSKNLHTSEPKGSSVIRAKVEKPADVDAGVWSDFERLRKDKRAPITETALRGIRREADKAGWSMDDALAECCSRGWQSFKASWVKDQENGQAENSLGRSMDAALDFLNDVRGGEPEGNRRIGGAASGSHPLLGFSG